MSTYRKKTRVLSRPSNLDGRDLTTDTGVDGRDSGMERDVGLTGHAVNHEQIVRAHLLGYIPIRGVVRVGRARVHGAMEARTLQPKETDKMDTRLSCLPYFPHQGNQASMPPLRFKNRNAVKVSGYKFERSALVAGIAW